MNNKKAGTKAEDLIFEKLKDIIPNLRKTSSSGARFEDGDMSNGKVHIDVKSTKGNGLPKVSAEELGKIENQADSLGKDLIIPIVMNGKTYFLFPEYTGIKALGLLYGK